MGRTGTLFAWQHFGVKPDIITLAKALGGGLPIGAMLARGKAAKAFAPGDHASTFGGNPVTCAAAIAVLREISKPAFLAEVKEKGAQLERGFMALKEKYPAFVKEVRGLGLMWGVELEADAAGVQKMCQDMGLLVNNIGDTVIRILPPLIVSRQHIQKALEILDLVLQKVSNQRKG